MQKGELMFGISGVRGIVGESLTPKVVNNVSKAFGTFICKTIKKQGNKSRRVKTVVARDGRSSGEELKESFIEGLVYCGCEVTDMGVLPTPVLLFNILKTKSCGGAVITASHNPANWNGVKFAGSRGIFINSKEVEEIYRIYKTASFIKNNGGKVTVDPNGWKRHLIAIVDSVNRDVIREREFKVVIASPWFGEIACLLGMLGCEVVEVKTGNGCELLPEDLSLLSESVVSMDADIGFITDADGDRLSIVTEKGEILDSEYTLPLVAKWVLKHRKGLVVTNLSTSKMIEDIVVENNCRLKRTKVGEANVVSAMLEGGAVLGGEGNGGIIDPFIHYARDSMVGMCRILETIAMLQSSVSELVTNIPKYYMRKEKITDYGAEITDLDFLVKHFPGAKMNTEDGIRVDFEEGWVHIRKSNTEPIIRVICETKQKNLTDSLVDTILAKLLVR